MIHQALHGYAAGHNLLATSLPLSKEQRMVLLQRTDLSGSAPIRGFDGYVSGFRLSDSIYALTKTWYAIELPRPGCVWTHSLLLSRDLLMAESVMHLRDHFRRPDTVGDYDGYSRPLDMTEAGYGRPLDMTEAVPKRGRLAPESLIPAVAAFYGAPSKRVCVLADSCGELEDAFLLMWNQQWPRMRASFSFTTGLLGEDTNGYALQGIPVQNRRLFPASAGFVIAGEKATVRVEAWARDIATDASVGVMKQSPFSLKAFLWSVGESIEDGRGVVAPASEVYGELRAAPDSAAATVAYESIVRRFGFSFNGKRVASALFAGPERSWLVDEVGVLAVLIQDEGMGLIECSDEILRQKACRLSTETLFDIIVHVAPDPASQRISTVLDVFYDRCEPSIVARLPVDMAAEAIRRKWKLAENEDVWRRPSDDTAKIIANLFRSERDGEALIYGLLRIGDERLLFQAEDGAPAMWVGAVRRGVDDGNELSAVTESLVLRKLWRALPELRAELQKGPFGRCLKLVAAVLEMSQREVSAFPLENVTVQAGLPRLHDAGAELQSSAFLLYAGLSREHPVSAWIVSEGFATIYRAAEVGKLPWDLWQRMEPLLPWHFLEWDRCARLIEGVVKRFRDYDWTPAAFFKTFDDGEQMKRAIKALLSIDGREYVRRVRVAADSESVRVSPEQRDILLRL